MDMRSSIAKINKNGALLVFPINNRKEPLSLWSEFFPKKKLRWEWNDKGDNHVFDMWALMKRLSDCKKVIYSKWYQNRATFFSRDLFTAMLKIYRETAGFDSHLGRHSHHILDILEQDSPLSTKELKRLSDLQGKFNEAIYNRAMRELFHRFLVVAYGEVEDGAFPSLAVGSTKLLYEDLWLEAEKLDTDRAWKVIDDYIPEGTFFRKYFLKTLKECSHEDGESGSFR